MVLGLPELGIVVAIVMVLFGSSKLPQFGKGLGEAISGFRKALREPEQNVSKIEKTEHNKI